MNGTVQRAEVVLPAASFAEATGTLVNMEGRAQRYFQNFDPAYYDRSIETLESWRWLGRISGGEDESENLDDVLEALEADLTQFKGVVEAAPSSKFRMHGMGLARAPHRQSGRTAARAIVFVHEPRSTRTQIPRSTSRWKATAAPAATIVRRSCCRLRGHPAGTRRRHGTSFRPKWAARCAAAIPGCICSKRRSSRPATSRRRPRRGVAAWCSSRCTNTSVRKSCRTWPIRFKPAPRRATPCSTRSTRSDWVFDEQSVARITIGSVIVNLVVRTRGDFPSGAIGLPVGLPGIPPFEPTTTCSVARGG